MKTITLFLAAIALGSAIFLGSAPAARAELLKIAPVTVTATQQTYNNPANQTGRADAPSSDNVEDYVAWVKKDRGIDAETAIFKTMTEQNMSGCIMNRKAFGFEKVADNDYKFNCLTAKSGKLDQLIEYRATINRGPETCTSEQKIREFFSNPANRNKRMATAFIQQCPIIVTPFVTSVAKVGDSSAKDILTRPETQELRHYLNANVNQSRSPKKPAGNGPVTFPDAPNPFARPAN